MKFLSIPAGLPAFLTLLFLIGTSGRIVAQVSDPTLPPPPPLGPAEPLLHQARRAALPTVWIAGDSTAAKGSPTSTGWGVPFSQLVESGKLNVVNGARGGRSSRTFVTEGLWEAMRREIKSGDWVLIQFGHNDAGPVNDAARARGSIRSTGEETQQIDNMLTGRPETVHSFGWYLRKMIAEAKEKGATPVVLSITVRNEWKAGKVERQNGPWNQLARETARITGTTFLDLNAKIADAYEALGEEKVKPFFPKDHTHTGPEGAAFTARLAVEALRDLKVPGLSGT